MSPLAWLFLLVAASLPLQSPRPQIVENDDYIITTVTDGVYALRHRKAIRLGALSGNTTVIIGSRDVLVVDSGSLPSVAADDIALIRTWTNKPVRYLVNTHWHGDHAWGNEAYAKAFPGLTILAHPETTRSIAGYLTTFLAGKPGFPDMIR
jgi:glyoxylase-like metal-dependent hydrolase (beta-lactamase superfamily II)